MNDEIVKIVGILTTRQTTGSEIQTLLNINRNRFYVLTVEMRNRGINIVYDRSTNLWSLNHNRALSPEEILIIGRLDKLGLTGKQIESIMKNLSDGDYHIGPFPITFNQKRIRFLFITDLHIGSRFYRKDVLRHAAAYAKEFGVDFILNGGDTIEGMSDREGHIFELDPIEGIGIDKQLETMTRELDQFGDLKIYSVEAQGSHGGWAYKKANQGASIGKMMDKWSRNYIFIGYNTRDIVINGIVIRLRHPEAKVGEDYVNGLMPNDKPHVLLQGHFHSNVVYKFHRNVHIVEGATMQEATPFLERKGSSPVIGYWCIEIVIGNTPSTTGQTLLEEGQYIEAFRAEFIPFYDRGVVTTTIRGDKITISECFNPERFDQT